MNYMADIQNQDKWLPRPGFDRRSLAALLAISKLKTYAWVHENTNFKTPVVYSRDKHPLELVQEYLANTELPDGFVVKPDRAGGGRGLRVLARANAKQEAKLGEWLWCLTGVYNFGLKKIENDARDSVYHSRFDFVNLVANHSKRMDIPSHTMQGVLSQAYNAWQRCFKKLGGKPRLKGQRNKLNSIPFPDPLRLPPKNRIAVPGLGSVRFHKQDLPEAKIKHGRIVKRASGWYLCLWLDCDHVFPVQKTDRTVGIDPGFHTLLALSNGTKIENPRELRKGEQRIAQAQRGHRKQLAARLQERQANRRRDRNHKISRSIVEQYQTICYSDDNFKGMVHKFGKSIAEAGLSQLIGMLAHKSRTGGRELISVASFQTTMTCSECGALSGPRGLSGLAVRQWDCACGAHHDRDINAAKNVLIAGLGTSLERAVRCA